MQLVALLASAGRPLSVGEMTDHDDIREAVRRRYAEAVTRLASGGAIADVVADPDLDPGTRADMEAWTGCIAGALTEHELCRDLAAAGFSDVEITETHRVRPGAGAAIIRVRR